MAYASLYERLLANIHQPENDQACWCWAGKRDRWGYGRLNLWKNGRTDTRMAHIEMLRQFEPIDTALEVDHVCRNPTCINPDHLEQVTPSENCKRRSQALA